MKDLTDADDYTSPITVPEGTDSRDDAAGDVERIAQALANRTHHMKWRLDFVDVNAALKNAVNSFTEPQLINVPTDADVPLLSTTSMPGDYATNAANRWKLVLAFPTSSTSYAAMFVGQPPDGFAIVHNARWHLATQRWRQLDAAKPSTGLVTRSGQVTASVVPAGAAPWADWPTSGSPGGGDLVAGANMLATGEYYYTAPHARGNWTIPLANASGQTYWQPDGSYKVGPDGAAWPLKVPSLPAPNETLLGDIHLLVEHAAAGTTLGMLVRRSKGTASVFPTYEEININSAPSGIGLHDIRLFSNGHKVDPAYEYSVVWKGSANDKIGRIWMDTFNDIGPRNLG